MQTNNHLKREIRNMNNFISNNTQPPEDLAFRFISELSVSNLLIPANFEADNISFPHLETDDGRQFLALFTDADEFAKYSDEFVPLPNGLEFYNEIIEDLDLNGAIINPMSDDFFVDRQLLKKLDNHLENSSEDGFDASKLREIADTTQNPKLRAFIADDENFNNFTDFPVLLRDAVLLNVVTLHESVDLDVVNRMEYGGFALATIKSGRDDYCALFTGKDAIEATADISSANYYYQVVNYIELFKYVLSMDMEGIIINPGLEDFYVPRDEIFNLICDHTLINPDLSAAHDYAFKLNRND